MITRATCSCKKRLRGRDGSLPAGAIEPDETPQEAVIREVAEETGLVVSTNNILGVFGGREFRYTYPNGHPVEYVVTLFKCQVLQNRGAWTDKETTSLRYFAKGDMPSLALPYPVSALFA
ncbi:NUDIX domain-containing protein [Rhizobium leguminosarum]|uniref:NUDIX domain-containing protein n=1 Tax=Rhizobium leguminosarum TaxID=384 RepID=UPI001FEEB942|nr:NUDIX domain-containing protein [Rhizobium leguminosarum]